MTSVLWLWEWNPGGRIAIPVPGRRDGSNFNVRKDLRKKTRRALTSAAAKFACLE